MPFMGPDLEINYILFYSVILDMHPLTPAFYPKEAITPLQHIIVDYMEHFFLPNLQMWT